MCPGRAWHHSYGYKEFEDYETSRDQYTTISESHIFSPEFNSARISLSRTSLPTYIVTNPSTGDPALGVPSVSVLGSNVSFASGRLWVWWPLETA